MIFFKSAFLLAVAGFVFVSSAATKNNLDFDVQNILGGNQGELCLDSACVGLAGNQLGYIELNKGKHLSNVASNKSLNKHVATHGLACFHGACVGLNDDQPFVSYLSGKNNNENILDVKTNNGFICLEGACVHLIGSVDDTTKVLNNLKDNGITAEYANTISICSNDKCADVPNFLSGDNE